MTENKHGFAPKQEIKIGGIAFTIIQTAESWVKSNGRIYRLFRIEIMTERAKSAIINDVDKKCGIFFEELL